MHISTLDWSIIVAFMLVTLGIGFWTSRKAESSVKQFFLSGNDMPWYLLGISMVATTFSADTPNLVTDIVRTNGVAGNWAWWAFLLTGMLTVFIYAKLWRRSGIMTDLEFYELRYSGRGARILRLFRAVYLGVFFNVVIMGTVLLAGIKLASILLGFSPMQTVLIVGVVTVAYTMMGGLRGVILTDFFQFTFSMIGMIIAAYYIVTIPEIGGLDGLLNHENVRDSINILPDFNDMDTLIPLLIMPLAVQWWCNWYPGAEPGGGGYVAQRMLSAKSEKDAVKSTMLFNLAHYALRPWPWILIALASLIIFPDLHSIATRFPDVDPSVIGHDIAFPAMLSVMPKGLLGLLIAGLISALMSTLSTHLNWGSSYIVNDFIQPIYGHDKYTQKQLIQIGRWSTVVLMFLSGIVALYVLGHAKEAFDLILQIGAGTGLVFILRWFWWRVNAYAEIVAMVVSFLVAWYFTSMYSGDMLSYQKMLVGIGITSIAWITTCYIGPRTQEDTLVSFFRLIKPHAYGWKGGIPASVYSEVSRDGSSSSLGHEIFLMLCGTAFVYNVLFFVGGVLYGDSMTAMITLVIAIGSGVVLFRYWNSKD